MANKGQEVLGGGLCVPLRTQLTWLGYEAFVQKMSGPSPQLPAIRQAGP
jgi:hypothetical protein